MILPPPRGDPSHLPHQSSTRLRRPERPRQKARYAPSRAAIPVESAARYVHTRPPLHPPSTYVLTRRVPRNATNGQTQRVGARHASASAFSALASGRSAPTGSRYVRARPSISWGSYRVLFFPTLSFNRKTIMSPSSVRRSRISWRRRE